MGIAQPRGFDPAQQMVRRLIGQHPQRTIEQRQIDLLPPPRPRPLRQRRLDADDAIEAGEDVDPGHADLLRITCRIAGQLHDAAHALDHEVVSRLAGARPGLPEARDRRIDQPRIARRKRRVIQPEPRQATRLEILDHHIGAVDQRAQTLQVARVIEVAGDAGLAAIGGVEIGGDRLHRAVGAGAVDEGWAPSARVVALRGLDLDDLGAQIGQGLADPGAGQDARQLDDAQTGERAFRQRPEAPSARGPGSGHARHACPHRCSPSPGSGRGA